MHSIVRSFVDNEVFKIMLILRLSVDGSSFYFRQPAMKQELYSDCEIMCTVETGNLSGK